jgi:hypothetical protein
MGSRMVCRRGPVRATVVVASFLLLTAAKVFGTTGSVTISIPSGTTIPMSGSSTQVTLMIAGTASVPGGITAFDLTLNYTSGIVTATTAALPASGDATNCDPPTSFEVTPGVFNISLVCPTNLLNVDGNLVTVTFQGNSTGMSNVTLGGCSIDEDAVNCVPSNGDITVLGPTSTATNTAAPTATSTITPTISPTPTQTNTFTPAPTGTSTPTATNTPTLAPTNTATVTPTVTPTRTSTATPTNTPLPTPRITGGNAANSTRVFGNGAPNVPQGSLRIFAVGPNGSPDGCSGDDEPLGTGGTDGSGNFNDGSNGIGLTRALVGGDRIFPCDTANGLVGAPVLVPLPPPAQIPTLTEVGAAALASLLVIALLWRMAFVRRRFGQ